MKANDLNSESGEVVGFEVPNLLLGRRGATKIIRNIEGVVITKSPELFRSSDDFCHFTMGGNKFFVIEPYGDNSMYEVVPENEAGLEQLPIIKAAFVKYRHFRWKW